ncbi:MAG: DUF3990 domain-containing protein [Clostridiales Family XIII bacterium]|jgi:hypothetical protein|nr:DUF3990 domain-containing protein [Clostridiales Family XIII bacterium]
MIEIYHGSTAIIEKPQILPAEYGRDFGIGFYTTDIREQAIRWANRKARIERRQQRAAAAILSVYEFDDRCYDVLCCRHFPEPTAEWLDMVCACRSDSAFAHGYDLVTGKIANDNVGETVSYVIQGIMRREDALVRLRFEQINNQICFNTRDALAYLRFAGHEDVSV